jgi:hypothetical protein
MKDFKALGEVSSPTERTSNSSNHDVFLLYFFWGGGGGEGGLLAFLYPDLQHWVNACKNEHFLPLP